jgi:4-amino-4-deoxy-L-arabinose transferase-like glycosyltransferase
MRQESIFRTRVNHPLRADAKDYFSYAYNLRYNHTFSKDFTSISHPGGSVKPDALRTPGYPLFISFFVDRNPSSKNVLDIMFAQMILSSITLGIAFYVFQGFLPKFWALAAASLTAISPHLITANSYILTETLFCFILVLTTAIVKLFIERPSIFRAIGIGICLGGGFLVRPSLTYFPVVLLVFLWIHWGRKRGVFYFATLLLGFMLVASPWYIRNLVTLHTLSDPRLKISFLHHGIYPDFTYNGNQASYGFPYRFDPRTDEIAQNTTTALKEILHRFQNRPGEHLLWYVIKKPIALWSWNLVAGQGDAFVYPVSTTPYKNDRLFRLTHRLARILHWPIVGLAFVGLWISWFTGRPYGGSKPEMLLARFVSALLIYFTLLHMVGAPFPRYAVPLRPLLYAMAMFTLSYCIEIFRTRIRPAPKNSNAQDEFSR